MKTSATIYMRDGSTREVTRSQGSRIQYILDGNTQGADDAQLEFAKNVKRVVFHDPPSRSSENGKPIERTRAPINDKKLREIQNDPNLRGIEKLRATMNYIKSR